VNLVQQMTFIVSSYMILYANFMTRRVITGATSSTSNTPTSRPTSRPLLTHVVRAGTAAYGVTSLENHVYVVRNRKAVVEVYDAGTMTIKQHLPVAKALDVSVIIACPRFRCLYVGDWNISSIYRLDLSGSSAKKKWSVGRTPEGLSVNGAGNLLVSCMDENKLQEYTTRGDLVREIRLREGVMSPWHAIQLSSGDYVVSQYTLPGAVSLVAADGRLLRSFKQASPQSDIKVKTMKYPAYLAIYKNGDILVADRGNDRILALDSALARVKEFPISAEVDLTRPYALWLDEENDLLYVGEMRGFHRLLVFSNVKCFGWKD